jgi:alpha-glucosidase
MSDRVWWKHGVVYQIYPRSFADSNGDGIGDLEGIRGHLDHVEQLGVDAIWLSPVFPSPMKDFGYDVANYCDIDPAFGTLQDMDALLRDVHARGMKLMLDWVPNHSSDQHPWFVSSRSSRTSPHRDFYVWRDPAPDGGPPNNWVSYFGGPAWTFDETTGQYYLHSFLREQPDLNWRHPEVEHAMHDTLRFWLARGVDGFRIDVVHKLAKDPAMRDNTPIEGGKGYTAQVHLHDENHEDVHVFLKRIRAVIDEYQDCATVGEVYLFDPKEVARYYGKGDELHLAFNFAFLRSAWSGPAFRDEIKEMEATLPKEGWPVVVLSNHDVVRHATRYGDKRPLERARMAAMLLLSLRATPFLYAGEELGLTEVDIPDAERKDPVTFTLGREFSRDGCRTPMPWSGAPHAGFSTTTPWLRIGAENAARHVAKQESDSESVLAFYKEMLAFRRRTPALTHGTFTHVDAGREQLLVFDRTHGDDRVRVALNFGDRDIMVDLGGAPRDGVRTYAGRAVARRVILAPDEGIVVAFDDDEEEA